MSLADKLVHGEILKDATLNDGLVVAEAAFHGAIMLVTSRECLLRASKSSLQLAIIEADAETRDLFAIPVEFVAKFARDSAEAEAKVKAKASADLESQKPPA